MSSSQRGASPSVRRRAGGPTRRQPRSNLIKHATAARPQSPQPRKGSPTQRLGQRPPPTRHSRPAGHPCPPLRNCTAGHAHERIGRRKAAGIARREGSGPTLSATTAPLAVTVVGRRYRRRATCSPVGLGRRVACRRPRYARATRAAAAGSPRLSRGCPRPRLSHRPCHKYNTVLI